MSIGFDHKVYRIDAIDFIIVILTVGAKLWKIPEEWKWRVRGSVLVEYEEISMNSSR